MFLNLLFYLSYGICIALIAYVLIFTRNMGLTCLNVLLVIVSSFLLPVFDWTNLILIYESILVFAFFCSLTVLFFSFYKGKGSLESLYYLFVSGITGSKDSLESLYYLFVSGITGCTAFIFLVYIIAMSYDILFLNYTLGIDSSPFFWLLDSIFNAFVSRSNCMPSPIEHWQAINTQLERSNAAIAGTGEAITVVSHSIRPYAQGLTFASGLATGIKMIPFLKSLPPVAKAGIIVTGLGFGFTSGTK